MNSIVEEKESSNVIHFSRYVLLVSTMESDVSVNFIKNILSNNNMEEGSTFKIIIWSVKSCNWRNRKIF